MSLLSFTLVNMWVVHTKSTKRESFEQPDFLPTPDLQIINTDITISNPHSQVPRKRKTRAEYDAGYYKRKKLGITIRPKAQNLERKKELIAACNRRYYQKRKSTKNTHTTASETPSTNNETPSTTSETPPTIVQTPNLVYHNIVLEQLHTYYSLQKQFQI